MFVMRNIVTGNSFKHLKLNINKLTDIFFSYLSIFNLFIYPVKNIVGNFKF